MAYALQSEPLVRASPKISLCMIVKNEAEFLAGCLESARGAADEVIVVDTGSTDATRSIAKRAGAKVYDFPWRDDFSAARNESLARASGDWVLYLDADERLASGGARVLRDVATRGDLDGGLLRIHTASRKDATVAQVLQGEARLGDVQRVPRFLRRTHDLRFQGVIHEHVAPWLLTPGRRLGPIDVDLVHLGACEEVYVTREKFERNVKLLRASADADPRDPTPLGYLTGVYQHRGLLQEAWEVCEEGWTRVGHVEGTPAPRPSVLNLAVGRAELQLMQGALSGVRETVKRARRLEGDHPDLAWLEGVSWERRALSEEDPVVEARALDEALGAQRRALHAREAFFVQRFVPGATGWAAWTRVGVVQLLRGEVDEALSAFEAALREHPRSEEAALGRVECVLEQGDAASALSAVEPLLGARPDGWVLAAAAVEEIGALDAMVELLARGQKVVPRGYLSPHRARRHVELLCAQSLYRGRPVAAKTRVGVLGAIMARAPVVKPFRAVYPSERRLVRRLVRNLAAVGRASLLAPLRTPRAERHVPGVGAHLAEVSEDLGVALPEAPERGPLRVLGEGRDVEFVRAMLKAHPALTVAEGLSPGQRVVRVTRGDITSARDEVVLDAGALLRSPVETLEALTARLCEADHEPLLRYVVEHYPGGPSRMAL